MQQSYNSIYEIIHSTIVLKNMLFNIGVLLFVFAIIFIVIIVLANLAIPLSNCNLAIIDSIYVSVYLY